MFDLKKLQRTVPLWSNVIAWVIGGLALLIGVYYFQDQVIDLLEGQGELLEGIYAIRDRFAEVGSVAVILYVLFYAVSNAMFVPMALLASAAGLLFDVWVGFLVVWLSVLLASQTYYWMGRLGGKPVSDWLRLDRFARIKAFLVNNPTWALFHCRFVFVMPFNPLNAACGLLRLPYRSYLTATALGWLPRIAVYVYLGASLIPEKGNLELAVLLLFLLIVGQSIYGGVVLNRYVPNGSDEEPAADL